MRRERAPFGSLVVLLSSESGAVLLLMRTSSPPWTRPDWRSWGWWLQSGSLEEITLFVAWALALALALWLLISTVAYLLAVVARSGSAITLATRVAAAPVRRLINAACTSAVVGGLLVPGASAHAGQTSASSEQYVPTPAGDVYPPQPSTSTGQSSTHRVEPGDNLWTIAEGTLRELRRPAGLEATRIYWLDLIELNRPRLRSGNPNLIYPGETVELPHLDDGPAA